MKEEDNKKGKMAFPTTTPALDTASTAQSKVREITSGRITSTLIISVPYYDMLTFSFSRMTFLIKLPSYRHKYITPTNI